jgi:tetratricopeptide (TPR) repeat protein
MKIAALLIAFAITAASTASAQAGEEIARRQAMDRYRAGQELMTSERYEQAAAEFRAAIELDPLLTLAHYGLGQSYMALKRFASAIQAFAAGRDTYVKLGAMRQTNAIDSDRRLDDEIRELEDSLNRIRTGNMKGQQDNSAVALGIEKRLDDLKRMRQDRGRGERSPVPAELSLALGSAYYRNGQAQDAERAWTEAVRVNSRLGEAHNNLAVLYMQTGRKKEAEEAVKAAERARFRVHPQLKADIGKMK